MQLKTLVKNKAAEAGISAQLVMQSYMMERLLERISLSDYRNNFILKGGFLIASIVGLNTRATMDIDTTIKGFDLTLKNVRSIFSVICEISAADDITFEIAGCEDIRETDEYPGIRLSLRALYPPLVVPLAVDITTGDVLTPSEIEYSVPMIFEKRKISILAYNLETILAEKLETIISRGVANTRPRDFYDVFVLYSTKRKGIKLQVLKQALTRTATRRGSMDIIPQHSKVLLEIQQDARMNAFWKRYQADFAYAAQIGFETVCTTLEHIFKELNNRA